jgi:2-succinyl-6-hydroxy-2,4-cyclohexadiene-1-carboxylate synthase
MIVEMAPTTLLLLHGFTNTGASWDGVVAALGESYRPLAPDIRGHGQASAVRPVSLAGVLDDLDRLCDGPFTLAGYSMGGRLALQAAVAPGLAARVQRLVLIGASPGIAEPSERAARRQADEALADEVQAMTIEEFAGLWARTAVLADQPPEVQAAARADRLRSTPAGLAAALRGLGTGALPSLWDRLGEVAVPVELLVGERDAKFRELASKMAGRLPAARVTVVPGAGHAVHLERPDAVAGVVRRLGGGNGAARDSNE